MKLLIIEICLLGIETTQFLNIQSLDRGLSEHGEEKWVNPRDQHAHHTLSISGLFTCVMHLVHLGINSTFGHEYYRAGLAGMALEQYLRQTARSMSGCLSQSAILTMLTLWPLCFSLNKWTLH